MSLTIDENGAALTKTIDGITLPIDCSFEKVNGWVHGADVQFEEVQALCLGMAAENDQLRKSLIDIRSHQENIGGSLAKLGAIWRIADRALNDNNPAQQ